ncbi:MAG: hypothetical protein GX284_07560 [Clostridiales bacterium]|nr:hypothetical protein [Clostridiales bacterium]
MKDIIGIIQFILKEGIIPIIVTSIGILIDHKFINKSEEKNIIPSMYILNLTGREKTLLNKKKIKKSKHLIKFYYDEFQPDEDVEVEKTIRFENITFEEILNEADYGVEVIGFENIKTIGLSLKYMNMRGQELQQLDDEVIPVLVDGDEPYCLICNPKDVPLSFHGMFQEQPVEYRIKGSDCVISAKIEKKKRRKRGILK